jgi:hypothetical protein
MATTIYLWYTELYAKKLHSLHPTTREKAHTFLSHCVISNSNI